MDRLSLLVKAKETAEYFTDKKFKYSQNVANSWAGAKTVSYTHLDVYKRQGEKRKWRKQKQLQ